MSRIPNKIENQYEDRRIHGRQNIAMFDKIFIKSQDERLSGKVIDISTQGALLLCATESTFQSDQDFKDVSVLLNDRRIAFLQKITIKNFRASGDKVLVGVQFNDLGTRNSRISLRSKPRAVVSRPEDAKVTGNHPVNFDDQVLFRVEAVTTEGMKLSTSLRNRFILPGMLFTEMTASFGHVQPFICDFSVVYCKVNGNGSGLTCRVRFEKLCGQSQQELASYLISSQSGPIVRRLESINQSGFKPKKLKRIVNYTYASTKQHFLDLQVLRWRAYGESGKIDPEKVLPDDMIDQYDSRSTIVLGYIGESLVSSVRLTECQDETHRFEIESEVDLKGRYQRDRTLEISRMCVLPEMHGTDLVHGMMEYAASLFVQSGKDWLITSCTEDLLGFYKRIGYRPTGVLYRLKALNNSLHFVIEITPSQPKSGYRVNPVYWAYTYARIHEYLIARGYAKNNFSTALKLRAFKLIAKIAMSAMKRRGK